jgi:hypothetical protein
VASTAVPSAKAAVVDSGEVGRSAVRGSYNSGPRTLPWEWRLKGGTRMYEVLRW